MHCIVQQGITTIQNHTRKTQYSNNFIAQNTIPENITQNDAMHRSTRNNHHTKPYTQNTIPENIIQNDAMHRSYSIEHDVHLIFLLKIEK